MMFLIAFGIFWIVGSGTSSIAIAKSGGLTDKPVAERLKEPPEEAGRSLGRLESQLLSAVPEERERLATERGRRISAAAAAFGTEPTAIIGAYQLPSLLLPATAEERERLAAERERISAAAAAFGTDPTAIIGFYQLSYGYTTFTNNLRVDAATAVVSLPVTSNFLFQVTMPYIWADRNGPEGVTTNGVGDMTVRTGGRLYASQNVALFIGADASFPTASTTQPSLGKQETKLGTGKYTFGPGAAVAVPLPRLRSLFITLFQNFNSVGGDPSRTDFNFIQVQSAVNTIWSERWWTTATMTWNMDWNNKQKTTMNLMAQVGHKFGKHWNVFAGPGVGVVGRDTFLGLDWTVQAGVRWVFSTPLLPGSLFKEPSEKGR
ncbi:MAG TPA: hypothetical protein VJ805_10730 [Nitrospiraceae bacterium]|nr:hypothetical protein [Nitrospiraceae bacterium]